MNPSPDHQPTRPRARAFTLIELLVSMAVLTLLTAFVAQLASQATAVTTGNRQRLDADSQARLVFDRLALDIDRMVKRPDVDYLFAKITGSNGGGNDKLFFYSEAPAFYDQAVGGTNDPRSPVALVGYRVNAAFQLERLGKVLTWTGAPSSSIPGGMVFLSPVAGTGSPVNYAPDTHSTLAGNWPNVIGSASDSPPYSVTSEADDYHLLAAQVFRFEFCFQLVDGTFSTVPAVTPAGITSNLQGSGAPTSANGSGSGYAVGSRWVDTATNRAYVCVNSTANGAVWRFLGTQDVKAVVVALGVLDATSTLLAPTTTVMVAGRSTQAPALDPLVRSLADATATAAAAGDPTVPNLAPGTGAQARLMAEAWGNKALTANFAASVGIPQKAAAQVRIYQRYFPVNPR